jgi:hypothetical protein
MQMVSQFKYSSNNKFANESQLFSELLADKFLPFSDRPKFSERFKSNVKSDASQGFTKLVAKKSGDNYLVNAFDADGLPCHFTIKCPDYMLAKMLKESKRAGCSAYDFGEIISSGFGHINETQTSN